MRRKGNVLGQDKIIWDEVVIFLVKMRGEMESVSTNGGWRKRTMGWKTLLLTLPGTGFVSQKYSIHICDSHISSIWPTKLIISLVIEHKSGVEVRKIGRNHFPTINPHIPLCTRYYLESTSIQCNVPLTYDVYVECPTSSKQARNTSNLVSCPTRFFRSG